MAKQRGFYYRLKQLCVNRSQSEQSRQDPFSSPNQHSSPQIQRHNMETQLENNAEKEGGSCPITYHRRQQRHKQLPSGWQRPQLLPICGTSIVSIQLSLFHLFFWRLEAAPLN